MFHSIIGCYNHYLKASVGMTSITEFDSMCLRCFLTLNASAPTETSEDILYRLIYEMVITYNCCRDQVKHHLVSCFILAGNLS